MNDRCLDSFQMLQLNASVCAMVHKNQRLDKLIFSVIIVAVL